MASVEGSTVTESMKEKLLNKGEAGAKSAKERTEEHSVDGGTGEESVKEETEGNLRDKSSQSIIGLFFLSQGIPRMITKLSFETTSRMIVVSVIRCETG